MSRSLLITVRFQQDRYHGQDDGFDGTNGWPPSPGRLFQALVAAAAEGANIPQENERALRWLERLDPPRIAAPAVRRGRPVKLYVPNNDLDSVGGDPVRLSEIRVAKQWHPCFFDPDQPVLYAWDFESGSEEATLMCIIAAGLFQLGRSIDMAWASGRVLERQEADAVLDSHPGVTRRPGGSGKTAAPSPGTFDSLVERHRLKRSRLAIVGTGSQSRQLFTQPPKAAFRRIGYDSPSRRLHFELRDSNGSFVPRPLASVASLIAGLRDAAAARLRDSLPTKSRLFDRLISGRNAGPADLTQRIRLIPIPSIGTRYTDRSIRRIVVEIPPDCPIRVDDLKWAFSGLEPRDFQTGEIWPGHLISTDDTRMTERFVGPAQTFKSVTPLALPSVRRIDWTSVGGEPKGGVQRAYEEEQATAAVVQALRHARVHISPVEVRVQREPFEDRGVPAQFFAAGTRFSRDRLWHAAITFAEPTTGPLLLGDGRYLGLGLMSPDQRLSDVLAFSIKSGLADSADFRIVAYAARRAMMARVQASLPHGESLPAYVSGHDENGRPSGGGYHYHIAVVADLPRQRLLYIAPNQLQRGGVRWRDIAADHRRTAVALEGMDILRAGKAGRLVLASEMLDTDTDPLFAASRVWHSVTDYCVTRHRRRLTDDEALKADVLAELVRIGWPTPQSVKVLVARRGPRGGLSGQLQLAFATAQAGPLVIGRTAHKGGGLFTNDI